MFHSENAFKKLKVVAIGGGNGLSTLLRGLKTFVGNQEEDFFALETLAAIVAVTDDGGSSGRLRDELQMLPPGDIRNCMVALSEDSNLLSKLFQHRFKGNGNLGGHSFGNLFLAAMSEITGDFTEAIHLSSEVLAIKGKIFPATTGDVRLIAEMENGEIVRGESNITAAHSKIKRLRLEPKVCLPMPDAIEAIEKADVITVGPGSLFTSLLPPLLVEDVAATIGNSTAIKVFICNLMTQPGETDDFSSRQHLEKVKEYAPQIDFDFIVVNNRKITDEQTIHYALENARQIGLGDSLSPKVLDKNVELIRADLLAEGEKVRHDPEKLARVVLNCVASHRNL
ncbi:MAG: uridine diphosphate-N-acetylglucosamine-binding protein YvcK [Pyrinomonadaceae bacterium]|nr:uridine diphosphate-N-acetylglucosamine-binding protein YvcK [Pyrinomonadaceae bacterium]